jgi:hypothetical protein
MFSQQLMEIFFLASACGHANAGQELCYLCHQRARRNIPVSFTVERKKREKEEDKLLQDYQYMKEAEAVLNEQVCMASMQFFGRLTITASTITRRKTWLKDKTTEKRLHST